MYEEFPHNGALTASSSRAVPLSRPPSLESAVIGFFRIVGEQDVPLEGVPVKLGEIAARASRPAGSVVCARHDRSRNRCAG